MSRRTRVEPRERRRADVAFISTRTIVASRHTALGSESTYADQRAGRYSQERGQRHFYPQDRVDWRPNTAQRQVGRAAGSRGAVQPSQLRGRRRGNLVFRVAQLVEQDFPCAEDAALDRTDSTTANRSRLIVSQAGYSDQEERLSLTAVSPSKAWATFCSSRW